MDTPNELMLADLLSRYEEQASSRMFELVYEDDAVFSRGDRLRARLRPPPT